MITLRPRRRTRTPLSHADVAAFPDAHKPPLDDCATGSEIFELNLPERRRIAAVALPVLALLLAVGAGYLKWVPGSAHEVQSIRADVVKAATDGTTRILSYQPNSIDTDLRSAENLLAGQFRDSFSQLAREVVIPGAREKHISSIATAPAAAAVDVTPYRAVVLVFVNQVISMDNSPPTSSASTVRVTLQQLDDAWLITDFTPI